MAMRVKVVLMQVLLHQSLAACPRPHQWQYLKLYCSVLLAEL